MVNRLSSNKIEEEYPYRTELESLDKSARNFERSMINSAVYYVTQGVFWYLADQVIPLSGCLEYSWVLLGTGTLYLSIAGASAETSIGIQGAVNVADKIIEGEEKKQAPVSNSELREQLMLQIRLWHIRKNQSAIAIK